jgi:hypothetical protein
MGNGACAALVRYFEQAGERFATLVTVTEIIGDQKIFSCAVS